MWRGGEFLNRNEIIKRVLWCLLFLTIVLTVRFIFLGDRLVVKEASAIEFSRFYAKSIWAFYQISNRFPNRVELTNAIFGSYASNYNFAVLDEPKREFSISATVEPNQVIRLQFQLSQTGIVENPTNPRPRKLD
jgi:hypothetical protein